MSKKEKPSVRTGHTRKTLLNILSALGAATFRVIDEGFLNSNYGFTGPSRALLGLDYKGKISKFADRNIKLRRNLFAITLRRLQNDGLVEKSGNHRTAIWRITKSGRIQAKQPVLSSRSKLAELPPVDGKVRIVSFDIPEKERWKRDHLRMLLVSCEYEMLQRSLWTGRRPLPDYVFTDIKKLKLRHFVHIFEILKKGTIRGLV